MTAALWFFAAIGFSSVFGLLFIVTLGLISRRLERKGRRRGTARVDR